MFTHLRRLLTLLVNQRIAKQATANTSEPFFLTAAGRRTSSPVLWRRDTIREVEYNTKVRSASYEDMDAQFYSLLKQDYAQSNDLLVTLQSGSHTQNQQIGLQLHKALIGIGLLTYIWKLLRRFSKPFHLDQETHCVCRPTTLSSAAYRRCCRSRRKSTCLQTLKQRLPGYWHINHISTGITPVKNIVLKDDQRERNSAVAIPVAG
jgi:hypothetical protein